MQKWKFTIIAAAFSLGMVIGSLINRAMYEQVLIQKEIEMKELEIELKYKCPGVNSEQHTEET